jgi:hypothetical protein
VWEFPVHRFCARRRPACFEKESCWRRNGFDCKRLARNDLALSHFGKQRLENGKWLCLAPFDNLWHRFCYVGHGFTALQEAIREHVALTK